MSNITDEMRAMPVDDVIDQYGVAKAVAAKRPAALLFTYRCSISCAHCLFGCGRSVPSRAMSVEDALEYLQQIHGLGRAIHIAGGEPFLFWDDLLEICVRAEKAGCSPHFIESNAFWAVDDAIARERLSRLHDVGVRGMLFSADPYHLAHMPPENVIRARAIAWEIFGKENVLCRNVPDDEIRQFAAIAKDREAFAGYVRAAPPKIVGNAAFQLAPFLPYLPIAELPTQCGWGPDVDQGAGCAIAFDPERMWEVHIDPYGNIQTNCGVILGDAKKTSVPELFARGLRSVNPMTEILVDEGPWGLLDYARSEGCPEITHAVQKCHLCFLVRSYLRARHPDIFGPEEVYFAAPAAMLAYRVSVK